MVNQVNDLRQERCGRTVAYSQFLNDYRKDKVEEVYGFVEAQEDISLYYSCISSEISSKGIVYLIPCGGKYNVRDTYNLIDWTTHSKLRICFFRDRDLSDYLEDDNEMREYDNCYYNAL